MPFGRHLTIFVVASLALTGLLGSCASSPPGADGFSFPSQPPLPLDTDRLQPGLAVLYFKHRFVRSLDALPKGADARERGWEGAPIPNLNHQFGRGDVFGSGTNRGIALELDGYIRLDRAGTYHFQANSNDGIRMYVDNQRLIDDPNWHSDRMSPEAAFAVRQPGWYSLRLRYFQRKGTASLQLYWKPPGQDHFSIVPAEVLAHQPSG